MAKRTKKAGITGKFGTRYGSSLRKIIKKFQIKQRAKYSCPKCGKSSVKRSVVGIWKCKACKVTFAGGAWELATNLAVTAKTTMNRLKKIKEDARNADEMAMKIEEDKEKEKEKKPKDKKPKEKKQKDNKEKKK